jgi:hypothetical protein
MDQHPAGGFGDPLFCLQGVCRELTIPRSRAASFLHPATSDSRALLEPESGIINSSEDFGLANYPGRGFDEQ